MSQPDRQVRGCLIAVFALLLLLLVTGFLKQMELSTQIGYARRVVFELQEWRDSALRAEVAQAAEKLKWASQGHNSKQKEGSPLDQICSNQRTNVIRDIVAYLRTKTGYDLGDNPQAWIDKYAPKR